MALRYAVGIDLGTSNTALAYAELSARDPGLAVLDFEVPQLVAAGEVAARPLLPSHLYLPGAHELSADGLRLPWDSAPSASRSPPPSHPPSHPHPHPASGPPPGGALRRDDQLSSPSPAPPAPADPIAVGLFARDQGARVPGRHVSSSKSWLCHPSVDRTARILPWGAPPEVPRVSPVESAARILSHVRGAWDAAHPDAPLAEQELVITVPASFDEGARALTLEAAHSAGLVRPVLLEEPQAAFYDWTRRHRADLAGALRGARLVLVVDVGGGTTDLTLIEATPPGADAPAGTPPLFKRLAVGDHLLLGGDNMDLALAKLAESRIVSGGPKLSVTQWGALVQSCRAAKERLLAGDAPERLSVTAPGAGSRLIGGTLATELERDEVRALVLDGFFPKVALGDAMVSRARGAGLSELGLPYAHDPAITRHVAAFLKRHARTVAPPPASGPTRGGALRRDDQLSSPSLPPAVAAQVDAVLFNGGALHSPLVARRLVEILSSFRPDARPLVQLHNDAPDLAVARGAATYALVRRGLGLRIGGGSPRTYFLGVGDDGASGTQALCVVPRGAPEGVDLEVPGRTFALVLGKPVRFRLLSASGYRPEVPGDLVELAKILGELDELPALQAVVPGDGKATVSLRARLTEIGTLELWAHTAAGVATAPERRWKLEFELRGEAGSARDSAGVSELPRSIGEAREALLTVFGKKPLDTTGREVKDLWRTLEKGLGERSSWSAATARDLWGTLWANAARRRRSEDHERLFLSLCGFALRPGFGAPLDAWRVEQTWSLFAQGLVHHKEAPVWAAWWILWRRIAAGLPQAAHEALFQSVAPHLRPQAQGRLVNPGKRPPGLAVDEMVRLLGSLERLPVALKLEACGWLLTRLAEGGTPGVAWALGRLGARVPVAGAAHAVLPPEVAGEIVERLLALDWRKVEEAPFAVAQLARRSGDRARDLDDELRARASARLLAHQAPAEWARGLTEVLALGERDEQRVFGEALPLGLHLA